MLVNRLQYEGFPWSKNSTMKKYNNFCEFTQDFASEKQCLTYLPDTKWGKGFSCRRRGHDQAVKGRTWSHRRCQHCFLDESCTAHTLLHKVKFPLIKAFWIVYQLSTQKKGMSTLEISRQYGIHQETAWFFKRKVQQAMAASKGKKLTGLVQVDEAVVGGFEPKAIGRSHQKKTAIQFVAEIEQSGEEAERYLVKRADAVVISNYSSEELKVGIEQTRAEEAVVLNDGWRGYPPVVRTRTHIALPSERGDNMPEIHWHIFNFKNWIGGPHHKVSRGHLQKYIDEFHFRFNLRNLRQSAPATLFQRMVKLPWLSYQQAIAS